MESGSISAELKEALETEDRRARKRRLALALLILTVALFGLDYAFHPQAARVQDEMVQELKTLPLPPNSTEQDLSSGFQPGTGGRASRTILTGSHAKEVCAFYSSLLSVSGWRLAQEMCYPSVEPHVLIEFRKGHEYRNITYLGDDILGRTKYAIVAGWSR
jgi:hypothetical protein